MSLPVSPARIVEESASPLLATPPSWPRRPLGEVAQVINGYAFKSEQFSRSSGMPLIRIRDIFSVHTEVAYDGKYEDRYIVRPGDLLVGMDGDFRCSRWRGTEALLNQRVCKVVPDTKQLSVEFLAHILPAYLQAIQDATSSTTVTHLSSRDLGELPIPVPSLSEQEAVARLYGNAAERQAAATAHLDAAQRAIAQFRHAVLSSAYSGRLTLDKSEIAATPSVWTHQSLVECADLIRGVSYKREEARTTPAQGFVPILRANNIGSRGLNFKELVYVPAERVAAQQRLRSKDVLLAMSSGSRDMVGKAALVRDDWSGGFGAFCAVLRAKTGLLPEFLAMFLLTSDYRRQIDQLATGIGINNLSRTTVSQVIVPIPPLPEQQRIVAKLTRLLETADIVEGRIADASRHVGRLSQGVLAKTFRGELSASHPPRIGSANGDSATTRGRTRKPRLDTREQARSA